MAFPREVYFETNFLHILLPLGTGLLLLIGSLVVIYQAYKRRRGDASYWAVFDRVISGMFGLGLGAVITFYAGSILLKDGGIHLPFETENEAIVLTGTVEQIEDRSTRTSFARYSINESPGYSWGNYVTIDGVRYSVVTWAEIDVGEVVTIVCLPQSRCILSYTKAA